MKVMNVFVINRSNVQSDSLRNLKTDIAHTNTIFFLPSDLLISVVVFFSSFSAPVNTEITDFGSYSELG